MSIKSIFLWALFLLFSIASSYSQNDFTMQIVLDKGVDAGSLKLFPGVKDKNAYWYLPHKLRLAKNEDGTPKMSFIKWAHNTVNGTDEGMGGGVLHCVFGFEVTKEELDEARQALRKINPKGKIMGSVIYRSGTVTVSVPKIGDPNKEKIVSISPAPTMEGNYVAVNLQLDKRSATLLWDSFDTPNPLVIFNFNMVLAGYNSPMEVKITIDRDQVYNNQRFQAGLATPWLSADIDVFVEDLIDKGAIKIEKIGNNFSMDKAIKLAITKATEEFFTPFGSSQGPGLSQLKALSKAPDNKSFLDKATTLLNASRSEARKERDEIRARNEKKIKEAGKKTAAGDKKTDAKKQDKKSKIKGELKVAGDGGLKPDDPQGKKVSFKSRKKPEPKLEKVPDLPSVAVVASYVIKKIKISGKKTINFKESQPTTIPMPFGGNLGVSRANCKKCFKEVNLDDKVYKQREVLALLDGLNESDFAKYINYGTIQLRKKHESGAYTFQEIRVTRKNYRKEGNLFKMVYGWKGDNDRNKWFDYEYKTAWSFFGGNNTETDWIKTNRNTINLSPPLQRKIVTIEADKVLLEKNKVRAVFVNIYYSLGGEEQSITYTVDVNKDVLNGQVEFMLPKGKQDYDYAITWRLWGNKQVNAPRTTTNFNTLYVDELPNQ